MAAPLTVEKFARLLLKSNLLTEDEAKNALRRWQEATKGTLEDDAEPLRKFLVAQKLLTEYQSLLLARGHSDGFFLDQYKILEMIGKGRMAGVYKAIHRLGQVVAIKVLPPSKARDGVILARFQREAKLLTKLDHPNVVRAFQAGESAGRYFLVMEHLEGQTLDDLLERRKRLPTPEAARIVYQALQGLQHVFEKGLIHRDLKPANIMLVPTGPSNGDTTYHFTVKILDIGLGRAVFDENAKEPDDASLLTGEGVLLGTPDYLAPEQARNAREADIRADIYSMGCVLYHLVTGQTPFPDNNILSQIVRHATEPPRPLSDLINPVPEGLQQVINWMLVKDPNQRYPTPARAAQALQPFLTNPVEAPTAQKPIKAYVEWLQSDVQMDVRPVAAPATITPGSAKHASLSAVTPAAEIPVGKIENVANRAEKAKEQRKTKEVPALGSAKAKPVTASPTVEPEDFDVELVAAKVPPAPRKVRSDDKRSLFELDRRDFIMAGAGAGLILLALLGGYGLSRLVRRPPPTEEPTDPQEKDKSGE